MARLEVRFQKNRTAEVHEVYKGIDAYTIVPTEEIGEYLSVVLNTYKSCNIKTSVNYI